jgi:hypothetical protein
VESEAWSVRKRLSATRHRAERFVVDHLPNSKYGPKDVVEKSVPPAVILELAFMDSPAWIQYYMPENIRLLGRLLGQTLKTFEEDYGPKPTVH